MYERLGVGGMATVHRAKERGIAGFERIVALKRLLPHLAEDESFVRAFVREAKLAAMLNHANIVQLYELGRVKHMYFISMEYIQGRDLRKVLRQSRRVTGPAPIEVTVSLLMQACDALDYAHTRTNEMGEPIDLIHRDVSPSNLLVNESGHLKVIDFGIAKAKSQQLHTQTGRIKGKMAYMAPEAIKGLELDARSDLFSTGVLAHELLTARPLFATKNDYQTLQRVQNAELIPPSKYNPECPPDLDEIVLKALCRDRDHRWQSAEEMRDALTAVKVKHRLSANARTVAEWMEWAFALEAPMGKGSGSISVVPDSHTNPTPASISPTSGMGDVPPLELDDGILEIAWEGLSQVGPVLLEEVPDVSDRAQPRSFIAATQTPSHGTPMSDGVVTAAADTSKSGGNLIAYVPPPDRDTPPSDWAHGTRPPSMADAIPSTAKQDKSTSDGVPLASTELSAEGAAVDSHKHVAATARATTSAPVVPAKHRQTTNRAATQIGAAIVERQPNNTKRAIMAAAVVVVLGLGGFLATRGGGGNSLATAGTKASAAVPSPGAGVTGERHRGKRSYLRFVLEPSDARIVIDGDKEYKGTGNKLRLGAGSYQIEVKRAGYKTWTATIDLQANENQTVRVALAPKGSDETSRAVRNNMRSRRATHSTQKHPKPEQRTRIIPPTDDEAVDEDKEDKEDTDADLSVSGKGNTPTTLAPTITPSLTPPKPRSTRTVQRPAIVPPHKVRKVSGKLPQLRKLKNEQLPRHLHAKLCINTSGRVTSVMLINSIPARMKRTLTRGLKRWRYRPYKTAGTAKPVCFVQSFKLR